MKKYFILAAVIALSACSTTTHKGINGGRFSDVEIETRPLQVSVVPNTKVKGSARCTSFLGFTINAPEKEAYGATMQTSDGNFEGGKCTRGAVYDAISRSNSEILIAPQYTVSGKTFGCFLGYCLYSDSKVDVVGYGANFSYMREMPEDVIKERFKKPAKSKKSSTLPGGFKLPI
ncbi:MAG: hypothetical protein IJW75_01905 [Alphaproteobacteria bacterium]|nr:hypothetical protein [Alphaproteobacteria bacterium]